MGSITKKLKAPTIKYVVPRTPVVTTPSTTTETQTSTPTKTENEIRAEARENSLLHRSRGRFGTIATSFRGLLSGGNENTKKRKTLLGE